MAVRRQLAMLTGAEAEAGQCWLQHAKLCRVSGHFEAATTASLEALHRQVPGADLQHAKLLWDMDKPHRAIISLQEASAVTLHQLCSQNHILLPVSAAVGLVLTSQRHDQSAKGMCCYITLSSWSHTRLCSPSFKAPCLISSCLSCCAL